MARPKSPKSYTSPVPVFIDRLYAPGEVFTTTAPKGKTWEEVGKPDKDEAAE